MCSKAYIKRCICLIIHQKTALKMSLLHFYFRLKYGICYSSRDYIAIRNFITLPYKNAGKLQFPQKLKPVSTDWSVVTRKLSSRTLSSVDIRTLQWKPTSLALLCRQRGNTLLKVLNICSEIKSKTHVCQARTPKASQNMTPSFAWVSNTLNPNTLCRKFFTNFRLLSNKNWKGFIFTSPTFTTWWIENHLKEWMILTSKLKTINLYVCICIHTHKYTHANINNTTNLFSILSRVQQGNYWNCIFSIS